MRRGIVGPSLVTAAVVGTMLTCVNQWSALRSGRIDGASVGQAAFNVALPFLVSLYSRWSTGRADAMRQRSR